MSSELKQKATHGIFWSCVERFGNQGVSFCFSIFLARILAPKDYGIVAMINIFTVIAQSFVESGFGSAIIRKPDLNEYDKSTAFIFNMVVGVACYIILFIASPWIADFYNTPILSPIIKVTSLGIIYNALCSVQSALLSKRVDFKTLMYCSLSTTVISGIVGVILAYRGYGVWALVMQGVIGGAFNCVVLWFVSDWRPRTGFSRESFHYLFGYGSKLLASGLLNNIYNNIYPIVIGKFYSPAQLGFFTRAKIYADLPSANITSVLQRVTFPLMSMIQDDEERLRIDYRRILCLSAYIVFPLMIGMAAVARPMIIVMITAKWEPCVVYLQIICVAMMWYPIHAINLNLLQVKGRSDLFFRLEVIKKVMLTLVMCVTIPIGVLAMCWGMIFTSVVSLVINTYYTGKLIHVGFIRQMRDLTPVLFASFAMGGMVYALTLVINSVYLQLILGIPAGVAVYLGISVAFKFPELREVIGMVRKG